MIKQSLLFSSKAFSGASTRLKPGAYDSNDGIQTGRHIGGK